MLHILYLFACACAYVQSEEYYYDRIAVNLYGHGHSLFLVDGISERDGRLRSCVSGRCHSLSAVATEKLKNQALEDASYEDAQYWYSEGLAAFLNTQSMQAGSKITPLYTVTHNDNGATIKWESSDIHIKQDGDNIVVVGPDDTYKLSSPNELLESTYQSGQYVQSSKVGRRYNHHTAVYVRQDDVFPGGTVSTIVFSPRG